MKEELASTSGAERRRESAALSLSKEEGKKGSVCVYLHGLMCAKWERGLAGESLGCGQASEEAKQSKKTGSSGLRK